MILFFLLRETLELFVTGVFTRVPHLIKITIILGNMLMRSKRNRDEFPYNSDGSLSLDDHQILREAANLAVCPVIFPHPPRFQVSSDPNSTESTPPPSSRRRQTEDDGDILERFSMQIVSRLQGSVSLDDAQGRAKEVLSDFRATIDATSAEAAQKAARHLAANKVLARALHLVKRSAAESDARYTSEIDSLRAELAEATERARTADHAVEVLRWHLQNGGHNSLLPNNGTYPPDVF
jgi:hypothetical protein